MSECYDSQKKPINNLRKLLQERIDKANPCSKKHMNELSIPTARGGKWYNQYFYLNSF